MILSFLEYLGGIGALCTASGLAHEGRDVRMCGTLEYTRACTGWLTSLMRNPLYLPVSRIPETTPRARPFTFGHTRIFCVPGSVLRFGPAFSPTR